MKQILIDTFIVPENSKKPFLERMFINRNFIKNIPGFIEDTAYEKTGGEGAFNFVTVAVWESKEALNDARKIVTAEYQRQGFDLKEMLTRLNIKINRAVYKQIKD